MVEQEGYFRIGFSVFLMVLILVGNGLVIVSYRFNSRVRTATYFLIISLALSDALIGAVTLPLWIYTGTIKQWKISKALEVFYLSFDIFTALASTIHLAVISMERFIAISRPFLYNTVRPKVYVTSILVVWSTSLVLAAIYPLAKLYPYYNGTPYLQIYTLSFIFVFFIAPLVMITAINITIFIIARKLTRREPVRQQSADTPQIHSRRRMRKEYKTALTLVLVTGLFYASWIPFLVVSLLAMFCLETCLPSDGTLLLLMELIKWFQYSQSAFNPLIYAFRDREMRVAFYRLFLWCGGNTARVSPNTTLNPLSLSQSRHSATIAPNCLQPAVPKRLNSHTDCPEQVGTNEHAKGQLSAKGVVDEDQHSEQRRQNTEARSKIATN